MQTNLVIFARKFEHYTQKNLRSQQNNFITQKQRHIRNVYFVEFHGLIVQGITLQALKLYHQHFDECTQLFITQMQDTFPG